MDRFEAMRAFVRVVEAGSFTRAADGLGVSRASVTTLVQRLEAHLRVRLLHRTTRRLALTDEGRRYFDDAVRLLGDLDESEAALGDTAVSPEGRIRADVPAPLARLVLIPALADFQARYPRVRLELGVSDRMVDVVADNVDCVIRGGVPDEQSLVVRRLAALPIGLCASPDLVARSGVPAHPHDLEDARHRMVAFVSARTGRPMPLELVRGRERVVVTGHATLALDDGSAYVAAGVAGLGIVCAPDYMTEPHVRSGELVRVLEGWRPEPMPIYLALPSRRHVSARLRAFIEWTAERLATLDAAPPGVAAAAPPAPAPARARRPTRSGRARRSVPRCRRRRPGSP